MAPSRSTTTPTGPYHPSATAPWGRPVADDDEQLHPGRLECRQHSPAHAGSQHPVQDMCRGNIWGGRQQNYRAICIHHNPLAMLSNIAEQSGGRESNHLAVHPVRHRPCERHAARVLLHRSRCKRRRTQRNATAGRFLAADERCHSGYPTLPRSLPEATACSSSTSMKPRPATPPTAAVMWPASSGARSQRPATRKPPRTLYQHESTLHTVMDELGLPNPPGAAASAPSMSEFLQK